MLLISPFVHGCSCAEPIKAMLKVGRCFGSSKFGMQQPRPDGLCETGREMFTADQNLWPYYLGEDFVFSHERREI